MFQPLAPGTFRRGLTLGAAALITTALTPLAAHAQDSTWNGAGNNFNSGVNWTPASVPTNRATFSSTGLTSVAIAPPTTLNQFRFDPNAQNYAINISNGGSLTLNGIGGIGIDNQSGAFETISINGTMTLNSASVLSSGGGTIVLNNVSNGGDAVLTLNGTTQLGSNVQLVATGGNAVANGVVVIGGSATTTFNDTSGADGRTIGQTGGTAVAVGIPGNDATAVGGVAIMTFNQNAHADNATFALTAGGAVAVDSGAGATAIGGVSAVTFNDGSHADGATFNSNDGGTTAVSSFDGFVTTAVGGSSVIQFNDTSHADNADFNNSGLGVVAVGGSGRPGTPGDTGAGGGIAIAVGGAISLGFSGDSHANGATIVNLASAVTAVGGLGGGGNTGVGGDGGAGQAFGSNVSFSVANNASLNNAIVTNTIQDTLGAGGTGGGTLGAGAGGAGGSSIAFGGNVSVLITDNASVSGTVFNNTAGNATATGGNGGSGGATGTGGDGGDSNVTGGNATVTFAGNVTLDATNQINNTAGNVSATGGSGGSGGVNGAGGTAGQATATGGAATVRFEDNASAGSATIVNTGGAVSSTGGNGGNGGNGFTAAGADGGFATATQGTALIEFTDTSTAGSATIQNIAGPAFTLAGGASGIAGGSGPLGFGGGASISLNAPEIRFNNNATGGSVHITNTGGLVDFNNNAVFGTAAGGGARIDNGPFGIVVFNGSSSLGNGQIVNGDGVGFSSVTFAGNSTAGTGAITNNASSFVNFDGNSTLGSATVTNSGSLSFSDTSDAVAGSVISNAGGLVNVFVGGFRLGSLSGNGGEVDINSTALQVGYLDRNETFGGIIAGTGALVKRGTGTFVLTGTNIYTGGTDIEAGTLQIGNGGTTGSIVGDITDNANLTFNRSDTITFANVISGTGTLTKAGAGTLILTNTNTYSGGTIINAGTLQLGNGGTTGTIVGNVLNNAALVGNQSNSLAITGIISGTGTVTQIGTGNLILTGANTYTGLTTISAGTLTVGNGGTMGSIVSNVLNNAALVFNRSNTYVYAGNISGTGTLTTPSIGTIVLTGTNTYTGGTFINSGTVQIGNGGTTGSIVGNVTTGNNTNFQFNRSDTITFGGVVSGTGRLTQAGTGTLVLTAANTYGGGTFINSGILQLSGSVASTVNILAPGTLTGTGTANGAIVNAGTITPGTAATPFGTLTATGTVTFNAGSFLAPTVNSAGQSSLLQAGSLTINGGQVRPTAVSGGLFLLQTDYRIANGTGGRAGTFTGVDASLLPTFLTASLNYVGNDVFLRLRRTASNFGQATGLTPNQAAAGGSLDAALAASNPLVFTTYLTTYNSLLPLSGAQLQGALNVLSGDALTAFPVAAQEHANRFGERLNAYTWSNSSNLWGLIAYGDQDADGDGNGPGFKANGVEFQLGFNTSLGHDTRLGLSVGMNNGDVTVGDRLTTGNVDTWSVGAQLRHDFGQVYASGQFTYSWHSIDSSRPLFLPGTATADYDAHTWTAGGELGWVIHSGQLSIEPHVSVRHANTSTDAYSESGPVGSLDVAAADYETTRLGIGIRLANRTPAAPVRFYALIRYEHETGDEQSALDNALPGLPSFRVVSTRLGDDILSGEVGAEFRISNGLSLFAAGGGHTRSNETSLQANAGLRVVF